MLSEDADQLRMTLVWAHALDFFAVNHIPTSLISVFVVCFIGSFPVADSEYISNWVGV